QGERYILETQESQGLPLSSHRTPLLLLLAEARPSSLICTPSTGSLGRLGYAKETSWNSTMPFSMGGASVPDSGRFGLRSRKETSPPWVISPSRTCCSPQLRMSTCVPKSSTCGGEERSRRHHSRRHLSRASL
uniref:Uncharacterized protein n=1 Tax=Jaculus jaculus TaxID=51337 RepID=A0A8C5K480_JACJA